MEFYRIIALIICIFLFLVIALIEKKLLLWIFFFCLSLLPFIELFFIGIISFYDEISLSFIERLDWALFTILFYFLFYWYIYIPAFVLLIMSVYKLFFGYEE